MSLFSPIQAILQAYDQPFYKKPPLASETLLLQEQLADWVHQIYFDQKKFNQLSVVGLAEHPIQSLKPNIACSIMYSIIRQKVQQVCKSIRQLIIESFRKLMLKKQLNCDLKHSSDSWNMNFYKFRKANMQTNMNKVYGPIGHIICTYHNSLLDSNKEVYDLWKLLYQCSEIKDLQFKTLQSSLNELILDQLMQDYSDQQLLPKQVMPTLSSFEKHQFIFKEMWGFQKRKLAVQFHPKNQDTSQSQNQIQKPQTQINMPKKIQKGKILSPPKPIPISLKQAGVNTAKFQKQIQTNKISQKQIAKKKALDDQIHLVELEQQVEGLDNETRIKILKQLFQYKRQPWFQKQKEQTLLNISKIILGNLTDTEKQLIEQRIAEHNAQPIELEIEAQQSSDDQNNAFQDQNFGKEELIDDNEFVIELQKIKGTLLEDRQHQQKLSLLKGNEKDSNINIFSQVRQKLQKINQNLQKTIVDCGLQDKATPKNKLQKELNNIQTNSPANIIFSNNSSDKVQTKEQKQKLPQLIPISKNSKELASKQVNENPFLAALKQDVNDKKFTGKKTSKKQAKKQQLTRQFLNQNERELLFQNFQKFSKQSENPIKYNLRLDDDLADYKNQNLYKKLKKFYQLRSKQQTENTKEESQNKSNNLKQQKYSTKEQLFLSKNISLAELSSRFADGERTITQFSNGKMSSKLQKMSQMEIVDQIYEIATKQKQKRSNFKKTDIKLTYKKISYQLRSGDDKNQIKITKGSITTGNWIDQFSSEEAKYHFSQSTDYGQKLIDEPNQDICQEQQDKQKKKKKKKKKKNKNKKQPSDQNDNEKNSISSQDDEGDLQTLQQFKKKSIVDALDFKKMLNWPEGIDFQEYLENSELMERMKEQQLLMEKKIQQYQRSGQIKGYSKQNKNKKEILNQDEMKVFQFLESLEIKDQNREKCVVTEETLQKILYKRKQIKSKQLFQRLKARPQSGSLSMSKHESNISQDRKNDMSNPKVGKGKNKKKKK